MSITRPFLICTVATARYAIALDAVREVLPVLPLHRPPTLPRPIIGFVTVRGRALAVLSPALLFDAAAAGRDAIDLYAHLVRLDALCLLVDRADDIVLLSPADIRGVAADTSANGCVGGEIDVGGGIAHLLLPERLLGEAETMRLGALTREAERRGREWAA